jgi:hypothetical protein
MNESDAHTDITATAARLRDERPVATALELDSTKRRVLARRGHRPTSSFLRSRGAIIAMLVAGFGFSGTGATLAVSGSGDQASIAQYGSVLPETHSGNKPDDFNAVLPETSTQRPDVQPNRQVTNGVQASDSSLPFTGFAAIPVLLLGIALLTSGLVFRRSAIKH